MVAVRRPSRVDRLVLGLSLGHEATGHIVAVGKLLVVQLASLGQYLFLMDLGSLDFELLQAVKVVELGVGEMLVKLAQ